MNNLGPMKNCPGGWGVQGNLNWMPGYLHNDCSCVEDVHLLFCIHFMIFFSIYWGS